MEKTIYGSADALLKKPCTLMKSWKPGVGLCLLSGTQGHKEEPMPEGLEYIKII